MTYQAPQIKFSSPPPATVVNNSYRVENPQTTVLSSGNGNFLTKSQAARHSNVLVSQHTHYQNTDNLYKPLKETFAHPEIVRQHANYTPEAAQSSMVSRQYKRLDTKELHRLVNFV